MVLPLIIVGGCCLIVGAGGAAAYCKWDDILIALRGKNICILGERETGKTTLHKYLREDVLIERYKQNEFTEKMKKARYKAKDFEIRIKTGKDFGGSKKDRGEWKKAFQDSDIVFYLFRADYLEEGNQSGLKLHEKRILDDLQVISEWIKEEKALKKKIFFAVGTHCDKISQYKEKIEKIQDKNCISIMYSLITKFDAHSAVTFGSLEEEWSAEELVKATLARIVK